MSGTGIKLLIGAKALLLLGLGGYFGRDYIKEQYQKRFGAPVPVATEAAVAKSSPDGVPELPKGEILPPEAAEIRTQLEFLRKDAETRVASLAQARQSYETAKTEVEEKLRRIEEERRLLEESLQKEKSVKEERLKETIEFLSKMEPRKAATVLEGMDRDLVILLLRKMPARFVTKTLEAMTAKKAVEFMEYYTRIRSGREYALMKELGLCKPDSDDADSRAKEVKAELPAPSQATGTPAAPPSSAVPSAVPAVQP
jgi:hypothetical protein